MNWGQGQGYVTLPSGVVVRGRRLRDDVSPADFTLVLARGPVPPWSHRIISWPDFWVPLDRDDALDGLHEVLWRARAGDRAEAACGGGIGRSGTALAALAVMDGVAVREAVGWVREHYHPRAVETPWQRRWLRQVS